MSAMESGENQPIICRLRQALTNCSSAIESGDYKHSDESIAELAEFLSSVADDAVSDPDNELLADNALVLVRYIHQYLHLPALPQAVVDSLSFELPKAVARFACVSQRCFEIAESIINRFIEICSARDMVSILCEALDSSCMKFKIPSYYAPLLSGLAKVLILTQRRQFEQLKVAAPIIVNVLRTVLSESDEEERNYEDLLEQSVEVAKSMHLLCELLEGKVKEKLSALLSLYVLQIMAFVSFGNNFNVSSRFCLVKQIFGFIRYCDMSYIGLITGCCVGTVSTTLAEDYGDDVMSCFSHTKHGAVLAVIWGFKSDEIAVVSGNDIETAITELSNNQTKRWQALGMLRYMFVCPNLSWELKKQAIIFLLRIFDGKISPECTNGWSSYMTTFYSALQAVEMVIMYAPEPMIKKNAFDALKKVLADIPTSPRFDTLMALIKNSDSSSMIAILIDCVRNEMHMENCQHIMTGNQVMQVENNKNQNTSFWNVGILELVALILRPPKGGPPSLPEFGDAVLSALNLYRFILMTESIGNSNRSGVLSKANLQKAFNEWLLPLRSIVTCMMAENKKDSGDFALDIVCGLNPIELVLYHCIELVEEKLEKTT